MLPLIVLPLKTPANRDQMLFGSATTPLLTKADELCTPHLSSIILHLYHGHCIEDAGDVIGKGYHLVVVTSFEGHFPRDTYQGICGADCEDGSASASNHALSLRDTTSVYADPLVGLGVA